MNARGNSLLIEEKERNRVNKLLPKLEKALEAEPGTDSTVIQAASQAMDSAWCPT